MLRLTRCHQTCSSDEGTLLQSCGDADKCRGTNRRRPSSTLGKIWRAIGTFWASRPFHSESC